MATLPEPGSKQWERMEAQALQRHHWMMQDLIDARRSIGLSQMDMADRMGISLRDVKRLERYSDPAWDPYMSTIRRYALAAEALIEHTIYSPIERNENIT